MCALCDIEHMNNEGRFMGYMTDGLTFNVLRQANAARLPTFKNKHGEYAHTKADGSDWSRAEWLEAITGELGEYANNSKKFRRGDLTEEEFHREAAKELADVVTYIDLLCMQLEIDLGAAILDKFNQVSARVNSTVHIREDGSDWYHKYKHENL